MSIYQAIIISLIYFLANSPWPFGGLGNYATLYRPMVAGFVVGLVLGDPVTGTIVGATINLMYIGFISAGGAMPADMSLAGVLGTALAITGGMDAQTALALALPLGLIGSIVWVAKMTLCTFVLRVSDKYIEQGETNKIWIANILIPQIILFIMTFIPCFIAVYYGSAQITQLVNSLSGEVLRVLSVIGGMLPAVGIGMMMLSIFKGKIKPYFFLGFFIAAYLGLGTLPIALIFMCVAMIVVDFSKEDLDFEDQEVTAQHYQLVPRKTVLKSWLNWMYYFQSCYNYERMQGLGFLHSMSGVIGHIYRDDKEERIAAMKRHYEFFNTENATGSAILGLIIAMEEQNALGNKIDEEAFTSIKTGLMGPLAGVGDTLWQTVMIPMLLLLFIGLASDRNIAAPILYVIIFFALYYGFGYWLLELGYKKGSEAILKLMESGVIDKVITAASILGCAVLGALVSQYVSFRTTLSFNQADGSVLSIQESLFDAILPRLLPLLLTLTCYWLIKKGMKSYTIILILIVVAVVGVLVGIL